MADKTEDFVLVERPEREVVSSPQEKTVTVRVAEPTVIVTDNETTVAVEQPQTVVIAAGQIGPEGPQGPAGQDGPPGSGTAPTISALNASGTTVYIGTPVAMDTDGTVLKANAVDRGRVIGIVYNAEIPNNTFGVIQTDGQIDATTEQWDVVTGSVGGLVKGARYFLSVNAGMLTASPDINNIVASVGRASSTTRLAIDIEPPIFP